MATLTVYPDAHPETTTVDGVAYHFDPGSPDTWSELLAESGGGWNDSGTSDRFGAIKASTTTDRWDFIVRSIFLFDCTSLPSLFGVTSATFDVYVISKSNGSAATSAQGGISLVNSNPQNNTSLTAGDLARVYTTKQASDIPYDSITTGAYNTFTLNSTGRASIIDGIVKFGGALAADVNNSQLPWVSDAYNEVYVSFADEAGTTQDPKLVINYGDPGNSERDAKILGVEPFFYDTFTEASNTLLDAHTPDTGIGWTKAWEVGGTHSLRVNAATDTVRINTGSLSDGVLYTAEATYPGNNYAIRVTMTQPDSSDDTNLLVLRFTDSNNFYGLYFNTNNIDIIRKVSGTVTTIYNGGSGVVAAGDVVEFGVLNSTLFVKVNGQVITTVSDANITATGKAGYGMGALITSGDDMSNQEIDNFTVYQTDVPATPENSERDAHLAGRALTNATRAAKITGKNDKFETLQDTFNDNSLNTPLWDLLGGAETNERLELYTGATSNEEAELISDRSYTLLESEIKFEAYFENLGSDKWVTIGTYSGSVDDRIKFIINGTSIQASYDDNLGEHTIGSSQTYNTTTHRFLRLRHTGSTYYFEYSSNSVSWNTLATLADSVVTIDNHRFHVYIQNYEPDATDWIDNVNTIIEIASSRWAYVRGTLDTNDERSAKLFGGVSSERSARLEGHVDAISTRNLKTTGYPAGVSYSSISAGTLTRYPFEATDIAFLNEPQNGKDVEEIIALVAEWQKAWDRWQLFTGVNPLPFKTYNSKATIAVAPTTCGAGCGYVGFTGIELLEDGGSGNYWTAAYDAWANDNQINQVPIFEMGRNFYTTAIEHRLKYFSPYTADIGGFFATWIRNEVMAAEGFTGAPFNGHAWSTIQAETLNLVNTYEAGSYTWDNTIAVNSGVTNSYGLGMTDLLAGMMMTLNDKYGGTFIQDFFTTLLAQSAGTRTIDNVWNMIYSASAAAGESQVSQFVDIWHFPPYYQERSAKVEGTELTLSIRAAKVAGNAAESTTRAAKLTGADGANTTRGAKLTGVDTSSSTRAAKTTGDVSLTEERDARLVGEVTTSTIRSAWIEGTTNVSTERDARLYGIGIDTSTRSSKLTGELTSSSTRAAKTSGFGASSTEKDVRMHGVDVSTEPVLNEDFVTLPSGTLQGSAGYSPTEDDIRLTLEAPNESGQLYWNTRVAPEFRIRTYFKTSGGGDNPADANYVFIGCASVPTNEDASVGGYIFALEEHPTEHISVIYNGAVLATANITFALNDNVYRHLEIERDGLRIRVWLDDQLLIDFTDSIDRTFSGNYIGVGARTGGEFAEHRVQGFFVDNIGSDRLAKIHGKTTDEDEISATIHGRVSTSATRSAKIHGQTTDSASRPAKIHGGVNTNGTRSAKTHGKTTTSSERQAVTHGRITDSNSRDATIHGQDTTSVTRSAKSHGRVNINDEIAASILGGVEQSAERDSTLTGRDTTNATRQAETHGRDTTESVRSAVLTGDNTQDSDRNAKTHGRTSTNSDRVAKTLGGYVSPQYLYWEQINPVDPNVNNVTTAVVYEKNVTTPGDSSIVWHLSNNGGSTWEAATAGIPHTFSTIGADLRARATLYATSDGQQAPVLDRVSFIWLQVGVAVSNRSAKIHGVRLSPIIEDIDHGTYFPPGIVDVEISPDAKIRILSISGLAKTMATVFLNSSDIAHIRSVSINQIGKVTGVNIEE